MSYHKKGGKIPGYSPNIHQMDEYDPWVGGRIIIVLGGMLLYYTVKVLYNTRCNLNASTEERMSYYERYKAQHVDRIRQKLLAKYRMLEQYDPESYSSTGSEINSATDSPSQDNSSGSPILDYTTHSLAQDFTSHWIDTQILDGDRRIKQPHNPMLERLKQSDLQFCMPTVSTKYPAIDWHDKLSSKYPALGMDDSEETSVCNEGLRTNWECRDISETCNQQICLHDHKSSCSLLNQETNIGVNPIQQSDPTCTIQVIPLYINGNVVMEDTMDNRADSRQVSSSEHTSHYNTAMDVEPSMDEESEQSLPFLSAESGETCSRHGILGISSAAISSIVRSVSHYEPLVSEYHTDTV